MCVLNYMYLIPSIVTVALLIDCDVPFLLEELLLLVVDNTMRISSGEFLLSWSDVAFARRVVLLSSSTSSCCIVGYVSSILLINSNTDISQSIDFLLPLLLDSGGDLRHSIKAFVSLHNFIHMSLSFCDGCDHTSEGNIVLSGVRGRVGVLLWLTLACLVEL